jgi:hypothetical protein
MVLQQLVASIEDRPWLIVMSRRPAGTSLVGRGGETGETLRRLLGSHGRSGAKARPSPGGAKIRQEWEKAWSDWEACVAESGDEDGRYVIREHHWEEPYLDASSLALDLEPIAARMRAMLERVMDEGLAPAFSFSSAIEEMDAEIGSGLAHWMDPSSGDGCALGPEVTGCLLEWEWRARRRDRHSAFELAEAIRKLEASARIVSLDRDTVARFILGLGDADQKLGASTYERFAQLMKEWTAIKADADLRSRFGCAWIAEASYRIGERSTDRSRYGLTAPVWFCRDWLHGILHGNQTSPASTAYALGRLFGRGKRAAKIHFGENHATRNDRIECVLRFSGSSGWLGGIRIGYLAASVDIRTTR